MISLAPLKQFSAIVTMPCRVDHEDIACDMDTEYDVEECTMLECEKYPTTVCSELFGHRAQKDSVGACKKCQTPFRPTGIEGQLTRSIAAKGDV